MRRLSFKRGIVGGVGMSLFTSTTLAGRSADPLPTFAYVLAFTLSCVALAIVVVAAINRPPKPPIHW